MFSKIAYSFMWHAIITDIHQKTMAVSVVPKLLWICTRVKVEVINNKTTCVRVKSTGGKMYLSKKYKASKSNSTMVCSIQKTQNSTHIICVHLLY